MSNELNVDVVATDKTAAGLAKSKQTVKKAFTDAQKDLAKIATGKGTFADFSKNLKSSLNSDKASAVLGQLTKARGVSSILDLAKGFGEAAEAAEGLAGTMGVLGVAAGGVVAGLGAAGAAAYAFSKPWLKGSANVGQLSMALGIATRDLQLFEGAAARVGVTKEGADQALGGLGEAAHAALYSPGGGQQRAMFGALGIDVRKYADKTGRVDLPALMQRVADGVQSQGNAQSQAHLAQVLGVSSALPALRQGGGWMRANMRGMAALGYYSDKDVSQGMAAAQNDTILGQYRDSLVRRGRGFVAKHGVTQGLDVAAGVLSGFVGAPRANAPLLAPDSQSAAINVGPPHRMDTLPGLNTSIPAIELAKVVQTKFAPAADKVLVGADKIEKLFERGGLNRFAAVGMTASGFVESAGTFDPQIQQYGGGNGRGIMQWGKARRKDFARWSGHDFSRATQDEEIAFALWELKHGNRNNRQAGRELETVGSYGDAGEIVSRLYEGPKDADGQAAQRRALAGSMGASLDATGHITVDVHLHDHRSRVKVTHREANGRVHTSMRDG